MSDYTSTFTEVDGVDDVNAADFSTEYNAIETAIATKADSVSPTLTTPTFTGNVTGSVITLNSSVATTSGASVDVTSIPSWVKKITINMSSVTTDGTLSYLLRLGDSGGIEITGYVSGTGGTTSGGSAYQSTSTNGVLLHRISNVLDAVSGVIVLTMMDSGANTWAVHGIVASTGGATTETFNFCGVKSLTAALDRVQLVSGDTFNGGSISVMYE